VQFYPTFSESVKLAVPEPLCPICQQPIPAGAPVDVAYLPDVGVKRTLAGRTVREVHTVIVHQTCGPRLRAAVRWFDGVDEHDLPATPVAPLEGGPAVW
jgi:hypothetical protein